MMQHKPYDVALAACERYEDTAVKAAMLVGVRTGQASTRSRKYINYRQRT